MPAIIDGHIQFPQAAQAAAEGATRAQLEDYAKSMRHWAVDAQCSEDPFWPEYAREAYAAEGLAWQAKE